MTYSPQSKATALRPGGAALRRARAAVASGRQSPASRQFIVGSALKIVNPTRAVVTAPLISLIGAGSRSLACVRSGNRALIAGARNTVLTVTKTELNLMARTPA